MLSEESSPEPRQNWNSINPRKESKDIKEDLEQSNPFKIEIREMSNPFQMNLGDPKKSDLFFAEQDSKKSEQFFSEQSESMKSNPFQMNLGEKRKSNNPFSMNLGESRKSGLFFADEQEKKDDMFNSIVEDKNEEELEPPFTKMLPKTESKFESHGEQNIKKYKEVLKFFYNKNYVKRIKNFEESRKKQKKESNGSQTHSQEFKRPDILFKANRLLFNKENKSKSVNVQKSEEYCLVSYSPQIRQISIFELKQPNTKSFKPIIVEAKESTIASCVEYDQTHGRIIYFNNLTQEIVIVGVRAKEIICRVKVKHQRLDPILYLTKYKSSIYLLVIGGYRILGDSVAEGSKYIEVFSMEKWEISLKQVIFRLGIGRINPIIFESEDENSCSIFIIGGYSNARINSKKQVSLNMDEDINFSTNLTGIKIDPSFIEDCFESDDASTLLVNNINVRFNDPLLLYGGSVLYKKMGKLEKFELFLPKKKQIFTLKILKNDVHIINSDLKIEQTIGFSGAIFKSIGYHKIYRDVYDLYRIDEFGRLCAMKIFINEKKDVDKFDKIHCTMF